MLCVGVKTKSHAQPIAPLVVLCNYHIICSLDEDQEDHMVVDFVGESNPRILKKGMIIDR